MNIVDSVFENMIKNPKDWEIGNFFICNYNLKLRIENEKFSNIFGRITDIETEGKLINIKMNKDEKYELKSKILFLNNFKRGEFVKELKEKFGN